MRLTATEWLTFSAAAAHPGRRSREPPTVKSLSRTASVVVVLIVALAGPLPCRAAGGPLSFPVGSKRPLALWPTQSSPGVPPLLSSDTEHGSMHQRDEHQHGERNSDHDQRQRQHQRDRMPDLRSAEIEFEQQ